MNVRGLPAEADGVFEGGGVKGIALVGGLSAAEEAGVEEWKNVAGTSAGAIVACLVATGYRADQLHELMKVNYQDFADYGWPGAVRGFLWNQFRMRGLAPGNFFKNWLAKQIAASPLARELNEPQLRFEHVVRRDLPEGLSEDELRRARYRLQVIASDLTGGRMLVLPHDIDGFSLTKGGPSVKPDELLLVDAVRMSMSYPYLFTPVTLWKKDKPYYIVDGGLLSNFPIWLFDAHSRPPKRPTWGFRLHGGVDPREQPPYRPIPMPFWRIKLMKVMFEAATGAWDQRQLGAATSARTVSIPTGTIATTDFGLTSQQAEGLFADGQKHARDFFDSDDTKSYLAAFAERQAAAPV
jgi:NTE family protein